MKWLERKRVVVTGTAGGLGTPVAWLLHKAGAHVIGVDRVACPSCDETILADLSDEAALTTLANDDLASIEAGWRKPCPAGAGWRSARGSPAGRTFSPTRLPRMV